MEVHELRVVCARPQRKESFSSPILVLRVQKLPQRNTFRLRQTRPRWAAIHQHRTTSPGCRLKICMAKGGRRFCSRRQIRRTTHIRSRHIIRDSLSRWLCVQWPRLAMRPMSSINHGNNSVNLLKLPRDLCCLEVSSFLLCVRATY